MKKIIYVFSALILLVIAYVAFLSLKTSQPLTSTNRVNTTPTSSVEKTEQQKSIATAQNNTALPLSIPNGFSISTFASNLPGARVLLFDKAGNLWVSQTSQGTISKINVSNDTAERTVSVFKNLKRPHGIAFDPNDSNVLYIAEEDKLSRAQIDDPTKIQKLVDFPSGAGHFTRTIAFGPDGRLYISIGSSCNVCDESDSRRAKIFSMNKDGSDFQEHARGLRNTVFFTWDRAGKMWGSDMGRDNLGDNVPPDEINIIEQGKDYGWPNCYGKNIHDDSFDRANAVDCGKKSASTFDLQAHSAPLGLAFAPEDWPEEYKDNLFVAYHGSWNRSTPTGYKIIAINPSKDGNPQDFISGFIDDGQAAGRPVDVIFHQGSMYISDDKAGAIYELKVIK